MHLGDVSQQEVLEALGTAFSPAELDWELVGVTFVYASLVPAPPEQSAIEVTLEEAPSPRHAPAPRPAPRASAPRKQRRWRREHDEIMAAVRRLSWEGYCSLVADIFRREGYEVFGGEGPDADVIDMEVVRGAERMLVNCQLRGLSHIAAEPVSEMAQVAHRNGADAAFIISDGDFAPEAWAMGDEEGLILIDGEALLGLVLDLTLGAGRDKGFRVRMRQLLLSRSGD
jgi:hypothetical protein